MGLPKIPLKFAPPVGSILRCCFDGFIDPEMKKTRPVIVVAPPIKQRPRLCTIVPLSTTAPNPQMPYHLELSMPEPSLPSPYDSSKAWIKGDMIYAVSFDRLERFYYMNNGRKNYIVPSVDSAGMQEIRRRILRGLGLRNLEKSLV